MVSEKHFPLILFLIFVLIYALGSFSRVPFGDCIGFVIAPEKEEFTWSTSTYSHFLFTNTIVFLKKLLPFIESIEIARWTTIISAALCIPILYKSIFLITKNTFASVTASFIFGLGFSFWRNAEIIEVYTFNLLLVSAFLYYTLSFFILNKEKHLLVATFILGISLFSHIQNILFYPAFLLLVLRKPTIKIQIYSLLILSILFVILFSFPFFGGENLSTVYSSGVVSDKVMNVNIIKNLATAVGYLIYNFWFFIIFAFAGCIYLFKQNRTLFYFYILCGSPVFIFSTIFGVSDNYVFYIPFNYIIAIFIGIGFTKFFLFKYRKLCAFSSLFIPIFYIASYNVALKIPKAQNFNQLKAYKGGLDYYLLPWMNNNVGIIEFTIDKKIAPDDTKWMTDSANEFIKLKSKEMSKTQIKKL